MLSGYSPCRRYQMCQRMRNHSGILRNSGMAVIFRSSKDADKSRRFRPITSTHLRVSLSCDGFLSAYGVFCGPVCDVLYPFFSFPRDSPLYIKTLLSPRYYYGHTGLIKSYTFSITPAFRNSCTCRRWRFVDSSSLQLFFFLFEDGGGNDLLLNVSGDNIVM